MVDRRETEALVVQMDALEEPSDSDRPAEPLGRRAKSPVAQTIDAMQNHVGRTEFYVLCLFVALAALVIVKMAVRDILHLWPACHDTDAMAKHEFCINVTGGVQAAGDDDDDDDDKLLVRRFL